jgi:hypothetical protein
VQQRKNKHILIDVSVYCLNRHKYYVSKSYINFRFNKMATNSRKMQLNLSTWHLRCLLCHLGFILLSVLYNARSPTTCREHEHNFFASYLFLICFIPWLLTSSLICILLSKILLPYMFSRSGFSADEAVGWGTALQVGRSRFQFPMVSLEMSLA